MSRVNAEATCEDFEHVAIFSRPPTLDSTYFFPRKLMHFIIRLLG